MREALLTTHSIVKGHTIFLGGSFGTYGAPIVPFKQGTATSYTATGLLSGTTYFFVATTFDSAGNEGLRSNEVSKRIF